MALDEAMLDTVAGGYGAALLRTYGWSVPTLSLGYFQRIEEARADPRWDGVPTVRRLTGGGAIWHHHEITYALAVPETHPLARPSSKLYRAVHTAILNSLRCRGVSAVRRGHLAGSEKKSARKRAFLCFTETNEEDIVTVGIKIVGSAQRRRGGAVLQHGSILLERSYRTPELPGVCDVADCPSEPIVWSEAISEQIPLALGLCPLPLALPEELSLRALNWEQKRYCDPNWTTGR